MKQNPYEIVALSNGIEEILTELKYHLQYFAEREFLYFLLLLFCQNLILYREKGKLTIFYKIINICFYTAKFFYIK